MANVTFSVRSDQFAARYSSAGAIPALFKNYAPATGPTLVTATQTGLIGPSYIDVNATDNGGGQCALWYPCRSNISTNPAISILYRAAFSNNSALQGCWCIGYVHSSNTLEPNMIYLFLVSGQIRVAIYDGLSANLLDNYTIASWTPNVGQYYDIVVTSTGTTAANGFNVYVDASLVGSATLGSNVQTPVNNLLLNKISIGLIANDVNSSYAYVNEFVIWDDVINPSALGLVGQSRTQFVTCDAFDGTQNTNPGISNVKLNTTYKINGISFTGSLGPFGSTDPGSTNVANGVNYNINGTSLTGSLNSVTNVLQTASLVGQSLTGVLSQT